MTRDFQIRTEDCDGAEGVECFQSHASALQRYGEIIEECEQNPHNACVLIELMEVLQQHTIAVNERQAMRFK